MKAMPSAVAAVAQQMAREQLGVEAADVLDPAVRAEAASHAPGAAR